ncbi:hypothetical protein HN51_046717 [Arachis hypogaea]|uniref:UBX domain-containing protein n=1 Tax=Arachis hypogaea TaxID=3818 RepID=A0A445ADT3_ARAHY|nr:Plant UBX domain-containing protein [Arachis hypogaea]RYR24584.1 hypothetical protein Ahy_B02g058086 [Arachis hypogaea]
MASPSQNAVVYFMRVTGAPEFVARQRLEEYGGNVNEAINAHFLQLDSNVDNMPTQRQNLGGGGGGSPQYIQSNVNDNNQNRGWSRGVMPFLNAARRFRPSLLLDPNYRRELRDSYNGIGASSDNVPRTVSTSQNVTGNLHGTHDYHHNDYNLGQANTSKHVSDNDVEEALIQAAIEASKNDSRERSTWEQHGDVNGSLDDEIPRDHLQQEDDDLAHALSLSIKTAEEEEAVREFMVKEISKTQESNSSKSTMEVGTSSNQNVPRDVAQPIIGHPSNHCSAAQLKGTEDVFISDKWGDISSDELNEALMLEAALFGEAPTRSSQRVSPLPDLHHHPEKNINPSTQRLSSPMSQLSSDTQLLRKEQDAAYLASLRADKQKELNSLKEAETHCLREEKSLKKILETKELEKQLDNKEVRLSKEPPIDDENAITIVVRMPDGSRSERRFLKSDKLQALFDFVDIHGAVKPGTYRVVKSYPRCAYSTKDGKLTFSEVGLSSKSEALFLEFI